MKQTNFKRRLCVILTILMVLSTIPAQAIAVDNIADASEAEFEWTEYPDSVTLKPGGTADQDLKYKLQVPSEELAE